MQIRIMLRAPLDRGWLRFAARASQESDHATVIAVTRISRRLVRPVRGTIKPMQETVVIAHRPHLAGQAG